MNAYYRDFVRAGYLVRNDEDVMKHLTNLAKKSLYSPFHSDKYKDELGVPNL